MTYRLLILSVLLTLAYALPAQSFSVSTNVARWGTLGTMNVEAGYAWSQHLSLHVDYNASAMSILQELERTPAVNYMLAVLYARNDDDQNAVQCYLDACKANRSYVFRGNLDPEINILIQRYGLNKQDDDLSDLY